MTSLQVAVLILIATAVLAALLWQWYRAHIFKRASGLARRVFPVWAAQGPFDSGEESAAAMRYAYLAVFGSEEAEKRGMVEAISKHAAAYDSNPAAWEQNRQQAMQSANSETEEFVTIAKGLAAMDSLKVATHPPLLIDCPGQGHLNGEEGVVAAVGHGLEVAGDAAVGLGVLAGAEAA